MAKTSRGGAVAMLHSDGLTYRSPLYSDKIAHHKNNHFVSRKNKTVLELCALLS